MPLNFCKVLETKDKFSIYKTRSLKNKHKINQHESPTSWFFLKQTSTPLLTSVHTNKMISRDRNARSPQHAILKDIDQFNFIALNSSTAQHNKLREAWKFRPGFLSNLIWVLSKPGYQNTLSSTFHLHTDCLIPCTRVLGKTGNCMWKNKIWNSVTKNSALFSNLKLWFLPCRMAGIFHLLLTTFGGKRRKLLT